MLATLSSPGFYQKEVDIFSLKTAARAICIACALLTACALYGQGFGYINHDGKIAISPQFIKAGRFCEGLAYAEKLGGADGRTIIKGYINKTGNFVFTLPKNFWFDFEEDRFTEGLLAVGALTPNGEKWGYLNKVGKIAIPLQFDLARPFSEGLAAVIFVSGRPHHNDDFGKQGYIDKTGKIAIGPGFVGLGKFRDGLANVWVRGLFQDALIDKTGKIVLGPFRRSLLGSFKGLVGETLTDGYGSLGGFSEGLARFDMTILDPVTGHLGPNKCGYIDMDGKVVVRPIYYSCERFREGLAVVFKDYWKGRGYINKNGEIAIELKYDDAADFSEGLAKVVIGGKTGYIDQAGALVVEPRFDLPDKMGYFPGYEVVTWAQTTNRGNFHEGLAVISMTINKKRRDGYINKTGKIVIKPQFEYAEDFSEGLAVVWVDPLRILWGNYQRQR